MELNVNRPALAGQDIDPDTFQRVWNRVMPNQPSPRAEQSIPDTAVPAEPTQPTRPEAPAQPEPSPVPACPAEPEPSLPPVPDCPAEPECPACPEAPECPACPVCPETPGRPGCPEPCLGDASQGDSGQLEELMALARAGAAAGRTIARRSSGMTARAMSALARDHQMAFRRLSAAYFLITGERCTPACSPAPLPASLPLALRQQFRWEQKWEQKNCQAARNTADPCLKALYQELAQEGSLHAGTIRSLLEQM